jgi:site-specific recombinase XerD
MVLGSVTSHVVDLWVAGQRERNLSEDGIASRLVAVKVFSSKFVCKERELTAYDLLARSPRIDPKTAPKAGLALAERSAILDSFGRPTFADVRNLAFVMVLMSTGIRIGEAMGMTVSGLDKLSASFEVVGKGGAIRPVRLSDKAMRAVRDYLRQRPQTSTDLLWVTDRGQPWGYWGAQRMFNRLKVRTGISRLTAHLLRHTFAQHALEQGAERAAVQDMLGHQSDAMTRRYSKQVRATTAAQMMPKYSPV